MVPRMIYSPTHHDLGQVTAEASETAGRRIEVDLVALQHGGHAILSHPIHIKLEGGIAAECLAVPSGATVSVAVAAAAGASVPCVPEEAAAATVAATVASGAAVSCALVNATAMSPLCDTEADRPEHAEGLELSNVPEHGSD